MKEYMAWSNFFSIILKTLFVLIDLIFVCIQIKAGNTNKYFFMLLENKEWENSWGYNKSASIFERKSLWHKLLTNLQNKERCITKLFMDTQSLRPDSQLYQ